MRKIYLLLVSVAMTVMANAQVDVSSKARTNQVSKARPDKASEALSAVSSSETKTNLPSGIDPNKIAGLPKADTTVPGQPVYKSDINNTPDAKIAIVDDNMFEKKKSIDFGNNNIFNKGGGVSPNVISATTYAFTSGAGTLEDMSSGTTLLVAADLDDIASAVTPIGFDFWFDGVRNTLFSANANGLMRIGVAAVTTAFSNDLASATNVPQIAPYWDDLWIGNNGKVHYKVVGSAPNRKLVVEWNNEQIPRVATATSGAGTFQAWLYESTGVIEFVYGTGIAINAANGGYSVGIGSSATQFASVTTAGATVAYGVANNTQTGAIASGTKYTFTPNTPADPTALSFTAVGLNTMTLNWVDNATNEVGYAIFRSVDGVNYEYIRLTAANAVSSIETGLASNTTWFWRVYAVTEGTLSNALSGSQATTTGTLTGTSTIGPTGTYPSIGTAVTDINTNGLAGSLILELQATYSSAGEIFPLVINTLGSPSNTITIRPEAAAIALSITSAATQTLDLSGATNVIIDGRAAGAGPSQLTIANTLVTGIAIRLINDASRNTIQYTTVQGVNTSATGAVILFSTTTGVTGNNSNIITNCDVRDGATTPVNCIASIGTSNTALLNTGNTVTNCNISNFHSATVASNGILVTTNTNISNTGWTISNNRVFQTASRASTATITHRGILVVGGNDYTVSNNTVGFANSGGSGTYTMTGTLANAFVGIQVQPGDGVNSIQGNTVAGISLGTTTGSLIGISVTAGSANIGTITGNTIGSGTGNGSLSATSTTNAQFIVGLNISGTAAGTINAANNTIGSLTSTGSPATINPHMNVVQILGGLVTFTNNSIGSTITPNSIQTTTAGTAATAQQLIGMLTGTTMPLTISGNTMANLTNFGTGTSTSQVIRGIQFQTPGVSATASNGFATISQNTVHDISGANANTSTFGGIVGIAFQGTSPFGASVDQNTVYTISATNAGAVSSNAIGIAYTNTSGTATKNKIYDIRNASTGTTVTAPPMAVGLSIQATGASSCTFANNMITLGDLQTTNTQFIGIRNHFSSTTLICHYNSVHIRGAAAAGALPSYGFLRGDNGAASAIATTVNIRNNIFDNTRTGGTGKHYAIGNVNTVPATGWSATASNNNVLNSPVAVTVGIWGLAADQTFAGWQTISLGDAASLSGVPVTFVNTATGDLHANFGLTPTQLESGGVVVATTVDYDNQTRPGPSGSINGGGTLPDIGADEFDGVPADLTGPTIVYTPLTFTCNGAINRTLTTTITDASGVPQVGIGLPILYWRINAGAWTPVTATWVAGSTYTFSFGAGAVLADIIQYYIVAQDNVVFPSPNVSAFPSAGASGFSINPPAASTPPTTPSSYTISATLSGTYTVGTAGTYPTLTAAVAAYNTSCLGGAVVFELLDISYTTRPTGVGEVYPIIINANPDASAINTLTIRPAATVAVAITGASATSSIIKLNGADYVTIDGLNTGGASLSITNTSATVSTTTVWIASSSASDGATNNTIRNCTIKGATNITTAAAILAGSGTVFGNAAEAANSNNTIQGNTINTAQNAIFISGLATTFDQNWSITNNIMGSAVAAEKMSFRGMLIGSVQNFTVSNNTIMGVISTAASSATMSGIQLALNVNGGTISRNIISDIKQINTLGWGSNGIYLAASSTVSDVDVYNNVIYDVASYGFADVTQADNGYGIMVQSGGGYRIRFNSVRLTTDQTDPAGITAAINISSAIATAGTLDIRDNIFANTQTVGVLYAIYSAAANTVFSNINYNDYYPGTGTLGFLGAAQGTIALWQTATGQDAFSVSVDPLFTSTTNLALLAGSPVISAGVTIVGITTDATASTRNSPPSMGAYESKVVYAAQTFLQGAYSAGLSRHKDVTAAWAAVLNANALLQPYNTAAFGSYAGTESVTAGFFVSTGATTDVTDWVLLELRDAVTPATIITRRAAFIREDGMIVDLDGISPVSFRGFAAGSYFVVVRHRNHLGVRSAAIQLVDGSAAAPTPYNFSSAQAQAFQDGVIVTNAAMVNLTGGVFGMWGGNANPSLASAITVRASGGPTINDYLYLINTALGGDVTLIVPAVYSTADMNMDGTVRASGGPAINDYLFLINAVLSSSVLTIINQHQ